MIDDAHTLAANFKHTCSQNQAEWRSMSVCNQQPPHVSVEQRCTRCQHRPCCRENRGQTRTMTSNTTTGNFKDTCSQNQAEWCSMSVCNQQPPHVSVE